MWICALCSAGGGWRRGGKIDFTTPILYLFLGSRVCCSQLPRRTSTLVEEEEEEEEEEKEG
jgi:hypothetical protein